MSAGFPPGEIESRLLQERIVTVSRLDAAAAARITASLLVLDRQDPEGEISLYVNSDGGEAEAGLAVYDSLQLLHSPVATVCVGAAAGEAALLVAAGTPGRRAALPNSRFLLRRPRSGMAALAPDAETAAAEARRVREAVVALLARHTGRSPEAVAEALTPSGRALSAQEALAFGLVDRVVERPPRAFRGVIG